MSHNLYARFRQRFLPHLDRPFLECEDGRCFTYAEVEQASGRFARRLTDLGIRQGDRLVVQIDKTPGAVFLYLACLRAGIIHVPLNTAYRPAEVAYLVGDCLPAAVVCRPSALPLMTHLAAEHGIPHVLTLDSEDQGSFPEGAASSDPDYPDLVVGPRQVAALLYTSGTTGRPKGAMMTHGHLWAKADALTHLWGWESADVLLHAMPIFHTHGLFLSMHCVLASGASMLFRSRFDAEAAIRLLPRCTVFTGVPTMYTRLLASPSLDAAVTRAMRLFIAASAPLPPETFRAFRERTGHAILECWGMTETLTNASNPLRGERRAGAVGLSVPGVELRVADETGRPFPQRAEGATGELQGSQARVSGRGAAKKRHRQGAEAAPAGAVQGRVPWGVGRGGRRMPKQVILVTGSSRGIGAALATGFARAGHRVVLNYAHLEAEAERLHASLTEEAGERVMAVRADVADRDAVQDMFAAVLGQFGRVDALINNAGLNIDGPFLAMTDAQWDRVIATNLTGTFICSQEFARRFTGSVGHILNVSASTALQGRRNGANYCSAKAGVLALTKCLALELAPRIRVNCLVPGRINTEEVMSRLNLHDPATYESTVRAIPAGRLGTPEDIFRVARFLIEESDYITGQNFFVNGGNFMY